MTLLVIAAKRQGTPRRFRRPPITAIGVSAARNTRTTRRRPSDLRLLINVGRSAELRRFQRSLSVREPCRAVLVTRGGDGMRSLFTFFAVVYVVSWSLF